MAKPSWLFTKKALIIDPVLAEEIGLNEALVLQQVNYWLHSKAAKQIDGHLWIYNTYENWRKDNFPFWSIATIKRVFSHLEEKGLLLTANYNRRGFDKTKWYSIDEDKLNKIMEATTSDEIELSKDENKRPSNENERPSYQNDTTSVSDCTNGEYQNDTLDRIKMNQPIPEITRDYTETTKDIKSSSESDDSKTRSDIPFKKIIDFLNQKAGTNYRASSKKTRQLIKARINDGFNPHDFAVVIKKKCDEWKGTEMQQYLRPSTLFGTKFEEYLTAPSVRVNKTVKTGTDWNKKKASSAAKEPSPDMSEEEMNAIFNKFSN